VRSARGPERLPPTVARDLARARDARARGDHRAAIAQCKTLLAAHPGLSAAIAELGYALALAGDMKSGAETLRAGLAADPEHPELNLFLADVLARRGKLDRAIAHLETVLKTQPGNLQALALAAACCERLHRVEEATRLAERAVSINRNDAFAQFTLATLESRQKLDDRARPRLERLTTRADTPTELRLRALTELGFVLDRLGEYDAAFDAFERAGAGLAETPAVRAVPSEVVYQRIEAYRDRVSKSLVQRFAGESFDTPAPAFLVGFPRSGTTMTERILDAHPRVECSDEKPLFDVVLHAAAKAAPHRLDIPGGIERLTAGEVAAVRREYWKQVERLAGVSPGAGTFVDKLPLNLIDLALINAVFPDSRVIVAIRDPRDVCLSCFMQWFAPNPSMNQFLTLPTTVDLYEAVMGLYLEVEPEITVPRLRVRYRDTVTDLAGQARRIVDHLDLEWSDELLRFHEKASTKTINTPSYLAVTEKVHTRAIGRWRHYAHRFGPLLDRLAPFAREFGYEDA